jgi:transposase
LDPEQPLPEDVATLQAMIRSLLATLAALQAEVAELREQLQRNSSNSSKPPSSDPPWRPARQPKPPSGRKPGGQPGHPGRHRRLLPPDQVDTCFDIEPECCQDCGHCFQGEPPPGRRKLRRHQVAELPSLRPHITEYRLYARRCRDCGKRTWASLPVGVPQRCVGPRAQAVLALLAGACRLSRRQVQSLAQDVFGIQLSLGTLSALEADTATALTAPYQEVGNAVVQEPVLFVDETSWREAGVLHWLWTVVSRHYVYYRLDRHRNREACRALLVGAETGPSPPCVTTDRYGVYGYLEPERRSLCWAHLIREFLAAAGRGGVDGAVAHWLLDRMGGVLTHWHALQAQEVGREEFLAKVEPLREGFRAPLEWGRERGSRATQALCRALLENWASLWAWQAVEGGEPTNNAAERALRPAVLWRKSSFGHQSESGKQFVERMLTVVGTLRQQQRNVWEYLVTACIASLHGQPAPTLLTLLPT